MISWRDLASCIGIDGNMFFPGEGIKGNYTPARKVCLHCPVQLQCLSVSVRMVDTYGMFGGTTPPERERIRAGIADAISFTMPHGDAVGTLAGYFREKAVKAPHCDACRAAYNKYRAQQRARRVAA